jgi:hypothetical protein
VKSGRRGNARQGNRICKGPGAGWYFIMPVEIKQGQWGWSLVREGKKKCYSETENKVRYSLETVI